MEQNPGARRQVSNLCIFEMQIHCSTVRGYNFQNKKRLNQCREKGVDHVRRRSRNLFAVVRGSRSSGPARLEHQFG